AVIHEEINRLSECYRAPIVLCDLEGHTCAEAARHLGCPIGTVGSRLARGREQLRDRLRRRGLAPSAGVLPDLFAWQGPHVAVPSDLADVTVRAAVRFASVRAAVQGTASLLALEVLRAMTMTRWWK